MTRIKIEPTVLYLENESHRKILERIILDLQQKLQDFKDNPPVKKKKCDLNGTICTRCKHGRYGETTVHDGWEATLHCLQCNHYVDRFNELSSRQLN